MVATEMRVANLDVELAGDDKEYVEEILRGRTAKDAKPVHARNVPDPSDVL